MFIDFWKIFKYGFSLGKVNVGVRRCFVFFYFLFFWRFRLIFGKKKLNIVVI